MTTSFYPRICVLLAFVFVASNSFSQPSSVKNLQPTIGTGSSIKIYKNVIEEFEKKFSDAEDVRWEKIDRNFLVKFSVGDLNKRALLNPKGNIIYEISYGKEKHLPVRLRKDIKRNYVEFTITSATFVREANRNIWVINLEDDLHYVTARIENDEIEEIHKFIKSKL